MSAAFSEEKTVITLQRRHLVKPTCANFIMTDAGIKKTVQ